MSIIPKKIHYVWFGNNPFNDLEKHCLDSWKKHLPEYEIIEWNEKNFDVQKYPFTQKAFIEKKWAFLSDFVRLKVLYEHGGIYLDTDMEVLKSLDNFLEHGLFLGMESSDKVNASIVGSKAQHWLLKEVLKEYENQTEYIAIPIIVTRVLERYLSIKNSRQTHDDIVIYPTPFFYPLSFGEKFNKKMITNETYTIHWWNYSWGSWKSKLLKKLGLFNFIMKLKNKFLKTK